MSGKTETVNLRAAGGNPPNSAKLIGTATLAVPDERFPRDLSWLAPVLKIGDRTFLYYDQPGGFGAAPTSEYAEIAPVVPETSVFGE